MDDPAPVRGVQRSGDLGPDPKRLLDGQRPLRQAVRQRLALQVLHDQVVGPVLVADVVERADVRVRELRDRLRLALEPLAQLRRGGHVRRQDLDGDVAPQARVLRAVNLAHAPGARGRR